MPLTPEEIAAQEAAAKTAQDAIDADAKAAQDALDADKGLSVEALQAALKKTREEAAKYRVSSKEKEGINAEQAARLAKLEAEEEKRRVATLSEIEKEKDRAEKAEHALAAKEAELSLEQRKRIVATAGIDEEYSDIIAGQLAAAQAGKEDFDAKAWLVDLRARKPALFIGAAGSIPSAGGPQGGGSGASKIEDLKAKVAKERDPVVRGALFRELQALKAKSA